jgi:hypothetical protein
MSESKPEPHGLTRLVTADEREEAVRLLTAPFANDSIAVSDFERRVAEVYKAQSPKAPQAITRDLPDTATPKATVPAPVDPPAAVARRPVQRVASVLSSIERSVQGPVPERLDLRSVMGSVELDLRRADFPPGTTEIRIRAVMGNIELELPKHVRVEDEGHAFLGNFSVRGHSRVREGKAAPVVRITGRSVFANVEIELDD